MPALQHTRDDTYELDGAVIRPLVTDADPDDPLILTNTAIEPLPDGSFEFDREEGPGSAHRRHWQATLGAFIGGKFLGLGNRAYVS